VQKHLLSVLAAILSSDPVSVVLLVVGIAWQVVLLTGVVVWLFGRRVERSGLAWLMFILILYFLPFAAGPEGSSRFRAPFEPLLALLSVSGWRSALDSRKAGKMLCGEVQSSKSKVQTKPKVQTTELHSTGIA
jgi:hypothetical protein